MLVDTDLISAAVGLLLTLMVFSYLIKDNALFRIAIYIFIGVASGYAATVIVYYVLLPKLDVFSSDDPIRLIFFGAVPLLLGVLVLAKLFSPRVSWIGNLAMALLVGVGAATVIGGAVLGTVIPQFRAAVNAFDVSRASDAAGRMLVFLEGSVMLLGTVLTLAAFHFGARRAADGTPRRNRVIEVLAWLGRIFIAITLGALFAGVYMSALTAMIERLHFVIIDFPSVIRQLLTGS